MSHSVKNSIQTLPIRSYLDDTVIPIVLKALAALAQEKTKPQNPIDYIADYLLKHNPQTQAVHPKP